MTLRCMRDCRLLTSLSTLCSHSLLSPTGAIYGRDFKILTAWFRICSEIRGGCHARFEGVLGCGFVRVGFHLDGIGAKMYAVHHVPALVDAAISPRPDPAPGDPQSHVTGAVRVRSHQCKQRTFLSTGDIVDQSCVRHHHLFCSSKKRP